MADRLWYVAYGSNLRLERLSCYVAGGRPEGGTRTYPGCRDTRAPEKMAPIVLPGRIYFAGESLVWGGGMAFYDRNAKGSVAARAYLLTFGQFSDIAAQEMRRTPGVDLDLGDLGDHALYRLGPGRYESIVPVGWRTGSPMVTITASSPNELPLAPPSRAYLSSIAAGLSESHGWSPTTIGEYLANAKGVAPQWSPEELVAMAEAAVADSPGPSSSG